MAVKLMVSLLLAMEAVTDIKKREIHFGATIVLILIGSIRALYIKAGIMQMIPTLIPGIVLIIVSVASRGKIGMGDGIVLAGIGFWVTLDQILQITMLSIVLSGIYACICLFIFQKGGEYEIPYLAILFPAYIWGGVLF